MVEREDGPTNEVLQPLVAVLAQRFVQRWDQYPRQLDDGRYVTIHEPLRREHLTAHLRGDITIAAYALDPESRSRFLVLDADNEPDWRRLKAVAGAISEMGTEGYLERSRRGGHLWFFLEGSKEGKDLRTFASGMLGYFGIEGLEVFPKQDRLGGGPGSSIRLPFGVHRLTGQRYSFYDSQSRVLGPTLGEQITLLAQPQMVGADVFDRFYDHGMDLANLEQEKALPAWEPSERDVEGATLADRIRQAIPVRQFVLQYVELSKSGKGLCPFHDDHVESFSVNDEGNYWNCFAGCGGGSVIDFWMKLRACDFRTALTDLSDMLFDPKEGYDSELLGGEADSP
jgi:hypothetical protein